MSTESVCTPSLDLLADSPPLSATAPYENYKDSPSTSPVKKKTKYNDEENLFTDMVNVQYLSTFLLKAIIEKRVNFQTLCIEELCAIWKEECQIEEEGYNDLKEKLIFNLTTCLQSHPILWKSQMLKHPINFQFDLAPNGIYYFIDNYFSTKFPISKILSLSSDSNATKFVGIISASNKNILDPEHSKSLKQNNNLIIEEISVENDLQFCSLIVESLTRIECYTSTQFQQELKGLSGGDMVEMDSESNEIREAFLSNAPKVIIFSTSEFCKKFTHSYSVKVYFE